MKILKYTDYFSEKDLQRLDKDATIQVLKEKVVNGYRICLVKKPKLGVDIFFKNGNISDFLECKTLDEAEKLFKNGLIKKYRYEGL